MNKWSLSSCVLLLLAATSQLLMAEDNTNSTPEETCESTADTNSTNLFTKLDPTLKVRAAAFWPTSERFTEVYGNTMPSYQIEAAGTIYKCYQGWINLDWVYKKGRSDHLKYGTILNIGNLSFGVSLPYQFTDQFSVYAGIGPSFGYIAVHNRHTRQHKNEHKYAVGVVVKSGLIYNINCRYFADFFVDYLYLPTTYKTRVNVGGLKAGVGLGTHF